VYRKPRRREGRTGLDLDSLMDILSCLVGVMLFLVIYTVLELGAVAYHAEVPVVSEAPEGSERVVVFAQGGTVRLLDVQSARRELLNGFEIVETFDEVPVFVEGSRASVDVGFEYSLAFVQRFSADLLGTLDLRIEERQGRLGETLAALDDGSEFAAALDQRDPAHASLTFVVDNWSVGVFRRAREMAISRGFATSWAYATIDFPLVFSLSPRAPDWLQERIVLDKPLR